jgi:asparagine synthase (glutamine-hydrolysing)
MCGIAGFWAPGGSIAPGTVERMTDTLRHRGPDAAGSWLEPTCGVGLGHRRLSIVDLSPTGSQPMLSASGQFSLVFNGEVYNFRELRSELEKAGHAFRGTSDTEVMLAAFEEWGVAPSVPRFAGMFAFAVWDAGQKCMWLARDRMGEKPLYLAVNERRLLFGSELKAITAAMPSKPAVDPLAVASVLRYGYVPAPRSIFQGVQKLFPGELVRARANDAGQLSVSCTRYWSPQQAIKSGAAARQQSISITEAGDRVDGLLRQVVADEMEADVPVGAFLSGGIDSSLVVALMQRQAARPVRTFTIAFEEGSHDESVFAAKIAKHLGTEHSEIRLPSSRALELLANLPSVFDEPFADSSQMPTWLVSKVTREHVTVALSGDGGDELFGGYSQHTGRDSIRAALGRVPRGGRRAIAAGLGVLPDALAEALLSRAGASGWPPALRKRIARGLRHDDPGLLYEDRQARWINPSELLAPEWASAAADTLRQEVTWMGDLSEPEQYMAWDAQTYLPDDILVKVDRSAMANSLETRAPLLDHRVFELAWSLPLSVKVTRGEGKLVLREVLGRYVPRALFERPKQGFAIPLGQWLRTDLRPWAEDLLDYASSPDSPVRARPLHALWQQHLHGAHDHSERLWSVFVVLQWLRANT